jgi:pimeloyl-ACP methyl ester carboxylesterase
MRACQPATADTVHRDGFEIYYERYGDRGPAIVLLPTWSLVHSRHWKMQIPYLARHFRVLCFDGRGSGESARPTATLYSRRTRSR